jgi:hypothetical protein
MSGTIDTKAISLTKLATTEFWIGALLLLCALAFYYFAVLRIDYSKTSWLDLAPHPDATEYFAQAQALRRHGWPSIQIAYDKLPSRYPVGYPVLMLPWLKILRGADAVLAPFRTNQTLGLLLLLAVFAFFANLALPLTGGLAALLLSTLPGFFTLCRSSLSEISGSALVVLAFVFAYLGLKEQLRWKIYLSALFLGLSVNVRIQFVFFAPLLLAMALFPAKGMRVRWLLHCAVIPIVFVLAASPLLVLNTIQFHSPFKTGYEFWVANFNWNPLIFSPRYVPINAAALWREFTLGPLGYHTANIFGTGTSFVPPFILLACAGFFFIRFDRFVICAALAFLTFLSVTLSYHFKFVEARFYLPLLILLVAVAVLPVSWAAQNILARRQLLLSLVVLMLFAAACLGYPSRSGYNTREIHRSQAWDAVHFTDSSYQSRHFIAQKDFATLLRRQPGIVLSDIDPVYLNALLPDSFVAAPIDGKHHYKWSKEWRYDRPQALVFIERGLQQSLPVYALFVSRDEMIANESRLPSVLGYKWRVLNNSTGKAAILKLAPRKSKEIIPSPG